MSTTYWQLLRDPRWQKKRLEILNRSNFTCQDCGSGDKTLNVHHAMYRKGAKPWEYEDHLLDALCEDCHLWRHSYQDVLMPLVGNLSKDERQAVLKFALDIARRKEKAVA